MKSGDLTRGLRNVLPLNQGFSTFVFSFAPWQISKVTFTPQIFFIFSLLQMPIVVGKSVNFLLIKFTPKAGQIYPRLRIPCSKVRSTLNQGESQLSVLFCFNRAWLPCRPGLKRELVLCSRINQCIFLLLCCCKQRMVNTHGNYLPVSACL